MYEKKYGKEWKKETYDDDMNIILNKVTPEIINDSFI